MHRSSSPLASGDGPVHLKRRHCLKYWPIGLQSGNRGGQNKTNERNRISRQDSFISRCRHLTLSNRLESKLNSISFSNTKCLVMWRSTLGQAQYLSHSVVLVRRIPGRCLQTTITRWVDVAPHRPSSKVEASVLSYKQFDSKTKADVEKKPSLAKRILDELIHYYHGFRLLFIEVGISGNLLVRVLQGEALSRREKKQLVTTTSDVFRLVPFSVFIIVPFMELTLPIFLKLFPNMLPSTFQTANEREAKFKTTLKVKLEMAKFLQQTLDEMALKGSGHQSKTAKDFAEFFHKIRSSGQEASNEEILRFSKLFEDEITLDSLSRPQLTALCRVLEIAPIGTNNLLRLQLRMRLRRLVADDKLILKEGIESLNISELQAACRARGMRSLGGTCSEF